MSDYCQRCGQPGLRFVTHVCPPPAMQSFTAPCSRCGRLACGCTSCPAVVTFPVFGNSPRRV